MESGNYKVIEERLLSKEDVLKEMNFEVTLKKSAVIKSAFVTKSIWAIGGIAVATVATFIMLNRNDSKTQPKLEKRNASIEIQKKDSVTSRQESSKDQEKEMVEPKVLLKLLKKDTVSSVEIPKTKEVVEEYSNAPFLTPKSVAFKKRFNTDAETAITIKDSIYGPTNVSPDKGDYCEYKDPNNEKAIESNSAWFKFTVKRDTLLTFHIVPTLKTDDYDFALFKCDSYNCMRDIKLGKLKPVGYCFGWNTTENANTGLSRQNKDTMFQMVNALGSRTGRTYAGAIRVKAGETYYLMVNAPAVHWQEPEGFMIYFYNRLPKARVNTYDPDQTK